MRKRVNFIILTISFFVLLIQIQSVSAVPINVNDSFDGPTLRNDLWTEKFIGDIPLPPIPGQFASNEYMHVSINTFGAYLLESTFYYTDDFDITVSLKSPASPGVLRFYKHNEVHKPVPHRGGADIGTLGDTWGFVGNPYSAFFEGQTPSFSYFPSGFNFFNAGNQWGQLRAKRTGSQITTYHRFGTDNSNPWIVENTFSNFSGSIHIDLVTTQGSRGGTIGGSWDNFTSDVLASTDPNGFSAVPEPATMALFGLGLLGLAGIGRRKTGNI